MKRHFEHVEQRKQRVVKYGQTDTSLGIPSATGSGAETRSYAMFSGNKMSGTPLPAAGPSELRRRAPTGCTHSNKKNNFNNSNNDYSHGIGQPSNRTGFGSEGGSNLSNATPYQISAQEIRKNALARQQNADSIEAIVSKVNNPNSFLILLCRSVTLFDRWVDCFLKWRLLLWNKVKPSRGSKMISKLDTNRQQKLMRVCSTFMILRKGIGA